MVKHLDDIELQCEKCGELFTEIAPHELVLELIDGMSHEERDDGTPCNGYGYFVSELDGGEEFESPRTGDQNERSFTLR